MDKKEKKKATKTDLPKIPTSLTDDEKKLIKELREKIKDYLKENHTDDYLIRWLKARDMDVSKAAEMFINSMKWRISRDVDNIDKITKRKYYPAMKEYWPSSVHGRTKDGWLVYWERLGKCDAKGVMNTFPEDFLIDYHIYRMEEIEKLRYNIYKEKGYTGGAVIIQDFSGLGWGHVYNPALAAIKKVFAIDADNYPEFLRRCYFINCPKIFTMLWAIVKPWVDKRTLDKIKILGSNYQEALDTINPEDIPDYLGGPKKGLVPPGGPCKYDFTKVEPDDEDKKEAEKIKTSIAASATHCKDVDVTKSGTIIAWEFSVEKHNVGFYVTFQEDGSEKVTLRENTKYECNKEAVQDSLICEKPGKYSLCWDNTFSWMKSKNLVYRLVVTEPEKKKKKKKRGEKKEEEGEVQEVKEVKEKKKEKRKEKKKRKEATPDD
eukprot:TRINITY_DN3424_c0_g1_i7.p1 TRINITY_DN3424_c0_g1~~TRINITY_DN3424_c0_g1_i7.p1  ORF type:complete len:434 (-),score=96.89 TRINITY_DN3424_c0_g1_i7:74-1375(-)